MKRQAPQHFDVNRKHEAGVALVTVILVVTVIFILGVTLSVVSLTERRSVSDNGMMNEAAQVADGISEHGRLAIIEAFEKTPYSVDNFLRQVRNDEIPTLAGVKTVEINGTTGYWDIIAISPAGSAYGWMDVAATASLPGGASQTVVRRVGFGAAKTFNLALLSETTNCMFCHLQVNGDVGNIVSMRPGWGDEGSTGIGSGGGSTINGNVYAARDVTKDRRGTPPSDSRLNDAKVTGTIEENSKNRALPPDLDGDNVADFPPIKRDVAKINAIGSLSGGALVYGIPLGQSLPANVSNPGALTSNVSGVSKTYNGNLILVGTPDKPIKLDGDIWVEGDVVIKGVVTGQGAIYTGRNTYIAGDVTLLNQPYTVGQTPCVNLVVPTGSTAADECAKLSNRDNKDALRFGARSNIVIGDYTERNADGSTKSYAGLQSSDFYRNQFGFNSTSQSRYYDRSNGDELQCSGSGSSMSCKNADGTLISSSNRMTVNKTASYDHSLRPGNISNGTFAPWMSDGQYSSLLGQETFSKFIWRFDIPSSLTQAKFKEELEKAGLSSAGADDIVLMREGKGTIKGTDGKVKTQSGTVRVKDKWGGDVELNVPDMWNDSKKTFQTGSQFKARYLTDRTWETQVNRVDAFLYANQRIAGKVNEQALAVLGGLVAKEIGILAPGRGYPNALTNTECKNEKLSNGSLNPYYVKGATGCTMTINYDHRLRQGGYGYNLISGQIGQTLSWSLKEDYEVKPQ
jgi:hypothetical protein